MVGTGILLSGYSILQVDGEVVLENLAKYCVMIMHAEEGILYKDISKMYSGVQSKSGTSKCSSSVHLRCEGNHQRQESILVRCRSQSGCSL